MKIIKDYNYLKTKSKKVTDIDKTIKLGKKMIKKMNKNKYEHACGLSAIQIGDINERMETD
ncbi:MAG: peptide deformylase [Vallitaleaceae bacterium]|nr:peptide deformylase [Vallitaleaceae bacterium]